MNNFFFQETIAAFILYKLSRSRSQLIEYDYPGLMRHATNSDIYVSSTNDKSGASIGRNTYSTNNPEKHKNLLPQITFEPTI